MIIRKKKYNFSFFFLFCYKIYILALVKHSSSTVYLWLGKRESRWTFTTYIPCSDSENGGVSLPVLPLWLSICCSVFNFIPYKTWEICIVYPLLLASCWSFLLITISFYYPLMLGHVLHLLLYGNGALQKPNRLGQIHACVTWIYTQEWIWPNSFSLLCCSTVG